MGIKRGHQMEQRVIPADQEVGKCVRRDATARAALVACTDDL